MILLFGEFKTQEFMNKVCGVWLIQNYVRMHQKEKVWLETNMTDWIWNIRNVSELEFKPHIVMWRLSLRCLHGDNT